MVNKIKQFIKENIVFLVIVIGCYLIMNYELPYVVYTPGGTINLSERIKGENTYDVEGSFSMTYVSIARGKIPFVLMSLIIPDWDAVSKSDFTYDDNSVKDTLEIDKIYMNEAISNAKEVAFKAANVEYTIKNVENIITYVNKKAKTKLKYGDVLIDIDGIIVEDLKVLQDYIATKKVGDIVHIRYKRDGVEHIDDVTLISLAGQVKAGISMAKVKEITSPYKIDVEMKSSESGPSGGLMTTLAIYNLVTEEDITNGKKIMGTGTIEEDGSVGEIGGVKYKLIGAVKDKADVFICPVENYEEAVRVAKKKGYNITILSAATFEETLDKLKALN